MLFTAKPMNIKSTVTVGESMEFSDKVLILKEARNY